MIYFAHAVGPATLGIYYLFLAYFGIFNLIGEGGLGGAAVKKISEGIEQNEYFTAFIGLRIAFFATSIAVLFLVEPYITDLTDSGMFLWLLLTLLVAVFLNTIVNGVYGCGKVGINQISTVFTHITQLTVQITAVFLGFGAAGLAGGFITGMVVGGLVNLRYLDLHFARFRALHVKNLFTFSFWIFLTATGSLVFTYADTIFISYFMTAKDVGIYRAAFQLTLLATFVTTTLRTVLYPKISRWRARGDFELIETALARGFTYSLLLAIPVCVGGWLLGDHLLYYLYGAAFAEGATVLTLLFLVQVANVFMFLGTMSLNALGHPKDSFKATGLAASVNILFDLLLIPVFGITGAAMATFIAITLNAFLAIRALRRTTKVGLESAALGHILIATVGMSVAIVLFRSFVPMSHVLVVLGCVILGALIYVYLILILDTGIYSELQNLARQLGAPWPKWLQMISGHLNDFEN